MSIYIFLFVKNITVVIEKERGRKEISVRRNKLLSVLYYRTLGSLFSLWWQNYVLFICTLATSLRIPLLWKKGFWLHWLQSARYTAILQRKFSSIQNSNSSVSYLAQNSIVNFSSDPRTVTKSETLFNFYRILALTLNQRLSLIFIGSSHWR